MTADTLPNNPPIPLSQRLRQVYRWMVRSLPYARDFLIHAVLQVRIFKKAYPGVMHALLFWGVTIQLLGGLLVLMQMQLFIPFVALNFPRGGVYLALELVMDLAGIAILLGVCMAAFRRGILRPKTLETRWDDIYALVMLALIPILGFSVEATRLAAVSPAWGAWSPVGNLLANLLRGLGVSQAAAVQAHGILLWIHISAVIVFIASIPFTKLRHLIFAPLNVIVHPQQTEGVLKTIDNIEEAELLGVGNISEFAPHQLLSFDTCVRCGRCEEACPVASSGLPYSPRQFISSLREAMITSLVSPDGKTKHELLGEMLPAETPWFCTTCGVCLQSCPTFVNPIEEIIDLRRYQALTTGKVPKSISDVFRNLERMGNPWGMRDTDQWSWLEGAGVRVLAPGEETETLLFLGCAAIYDERNKKITRALTGLLQRSGVEFAILGDGEACCGETARRLGQEYLFQVLAKQNIETFARYRFKRIVTACPHCYNTLKNEYQQFGGSFQVMHSTEYLSELSSKWKEMPAPGSGIDGRLAYHDSCYLGRYNQVYKEPRRLLDSAGLNRVEMARQGEDSFCCGGGGGQMWMESSADTRVNQRRLQDALDAQADVIATACPYCLLMFDDAIRSKGLGEKIKVMDIAEILAARTGL